jgi:hypothetical protein
MFHLFSSLQIASGRDQRFSNSVHQSQNVLVLQVWRSSHLRRRFPHVSTRWRSGLRLLDKLRKSMGRGLDFGATAAISLVHCNHMNMENSEIARCIDSRHELYMGLSSIRAGSTSSTTPGSPDPAYLLRVRSVTFSVSRSARDASDTSRTRPRVEKKHICLRH